MKMFYRMILPFLGNTLYVYHSYHMENTFRIMTLTIRWDDGYLFIWGKSLVDLRPKETQNCPMHSLGAA